MTTVVSVPAIQQQSTNLALGAVHLTEEPKIHGLVGAQFGDLEYDVGKSVRWLDFYTDTLFITDISTGEQRYWIVNWTESFPGSEHIVTGTNFFTQTAQFRKEQFAAAQKAFPYQDTDWCLFVDAHEGISFDNTTLPNDYEIMPFMSWMYREVTRAVTAGQDTVVIPFFVYLKNSDLQNVVYSTTASQGASSLGLPAVSQPLSVPWYLPQQGLPRLFKVSALKNPSFDWSKLDRPVAPSVGVKVQIVSYAYAHWQMLTIPPGQTTVPPLDATTDLGWQMRKLISMARPIAGIPYTEPWKDPSTDPTSYPGPWAVDTMSNIDPAIITTIEEYGHTAPAAQCASLRVPLYDHEIRWNLRDGLWYERGLSGNIPMTWDDANKVWVPNYPPEDWPSQGVTAERLDAPPPNPMSLRLNGSAGTYVRTADANYFDFSHSLTIGVVIAIDDVTPSGRKAIVSKWGAAGQRSWYWAVGNNGGLVLTISHDGTNGIDFVLPAADVPFGDGDEVAIGVSLDSILETTAADGTLVPAQEQVAFWQWSETDGWQVIGDPILVANPDGLALFNSTTEVQVGAIQGGQNLAGLFRVVSLRTGTGATDEFSTDEVARMRGDLTVNPSYDRYGNLWTNQGTGWSHVPMTDPPMPPV